MRIEFYDPGDRDEVLAVVNRAFGFPRDEDWFTWKHVDGPWGPSVGMVARDTRGIVGVRLLLPWLLLGPEGTPTLVYRAVEASTLPRAQGQGVFSRLNRSLMSWVAAERPAGAIFSTPNALSRDGYRKLGWTWREPVRHVRRLVRPRRVEGGGLRANRDAVEAFALARVGHGVVTTAWDPESLRWRLDGRSGNAYQVGVTEAADGRGGVAVRVLDQHPRTLLVLLRWGSPHASRLALATLSARTRAWVTLEAVDQTRKAPRGLRRGHSLLAVWAPEGAWHLGATMARSDGWATTFADLESVL